MIIFSLARYLKVKICVLCFMKSSFFSLSRADEDENDGLILPVKPELLGPLVSKLKSIYIKFSEFILIFVS